MVDNRRTVDGRTADDGWTPDHGHPISSQYEPKGSGELKINIKKCKISRNMEPRAIKCHMRYTFIRTNLFLEYRV